MSSLLTDSRPKIDVRPAQRPGSVWRRVVLARLAQLRHGRLELREGDTVETLGDTGPIAAVIRISDPAFFRAVALGGSVGAAEAYMDGHWQCTDLPALVRLLLRNRDTLDRFGNMAGVVLKPFRRVGHWLQRNTRRGSQRNIAAHYDLGNDFFELFLDPTMTYSCGIFERGSSSLEEASVAKLDRICRKLDLKPSDRVLEIGCGWGSFAIHAARHYGCRVTATTISGRQHEVATRRVREAGLDSLVRIVNKDYRDLVGTYDKIASIEMIEAIGHAYYPVFFKCCSDLLTPDGMALIQAITIQDQHYDRARREVDFIKRYVFPGCCIPAITPLCQAAATADLRLTHLEDITPHYVTTLRMWRENFTARLDDVRALGYSELFIRMWEYYLSYCAGAFAERYIGDVHLLFAKPHCQRAPILPPLRDVV